MLVARATCAPCLHRWQWIRARAGRQLHVSACSRDSRQPSTQHNRALEPGQGLRPSSWAIAIKESTAREGPFLLNIVAFSTIGAATIKYGSLAVDTPFQPNTAIALALVFGPSLLYSIIMRGWSSRQGEQ